MSNPCRLYAFIVVLVVSSGCGGGARSKHGLPPTPYDWVGRGDRVRAEDPARALANYKRASGWGTEPPDLDTKTQETAKAWLQREVEQRRPTFGEAPAADWSFLKAAREAAELWKVPLEALNIAGLEEAAIAQVWHRHRDERPKDATPYEAIGYAEGARLVIPEAFTAVHAEIDADVARLRADVVSRTQRLLDTAPSTLAGARHLYRSVLDSLAARDIDKPTRDLLAKRARLGADVSAGPSSCEVGARTVAMAKSLTEGARRVSIRIENLTCTTRERFTPDTVVVKELVTKKIAIERPRPEICGREFRVTCYHPDPQRCPPAKEVCTKDPRGPEVVGHTEKEVLEQRTIKVDVRVLEAEIKGVLVIDNGGTVERRPLDVSVTERETIQDPKSRERPRRDRRRVGVDEPLAEAFSPATPQDLLVSRAPRRVLTEIERILRDLQRPIAEGYVDAAKRKLAAGDHHGAADDVMLALAAGAYVSSATGPLAAAAGMPPAVWEEAVRGTKYLTRPKVVKPPPLRDAKLELPSHDLDVRYGEVPAPEEPLAARSAAPEAPEVRLAPDPTSGRSSLGVGLSQWHPPNGENTWGVTALFARGALRGNRRFWFHEEIAAAEIQSSGAIGLEGQLRVGIGTRTPKVLGALHLSGSVARRGETNDSDIGLSPAPELGVGVRLVLAPLGLRRFELLFERLARPTSGDTPVRLRYELRYLRGPGALGVKGWCSFEQAASSDVLTPSSTNTNRACVLAGMYLF